MHRRSMEMYEEKFTSKKYTENIERIYKEMEAEPKIKRINVLDAIIILIVLVACIVGYTYINKKEMTIAPKNTEKITYQIRTMDSLPASYDMIEENTVIYDSVKNNPIGTIVKKEILPAEKYEVDMNKGVYVKSDLPAENYVDILLTIEADAVVGEQDISVGSYVVKVGEQAYVKGKGIVLREPSVVAVDNNTGNVLAVGKEARRMLGRTPGNIVATRPLREGVISNYTVTEKMLKYFINRVCGKFVFSPRIMICIPSQVTEVEKKAVIDAASQAGARRVYLIEEPIAAAIGAGIDISKPCGNMVVDIGGGTTDIAVISLGGSVVSESLKVAGDKFDEAIVKYIKKKHNVMIGERTAEDLKINIGCVYPKIQDMDMDIRGRDLVTGLPKTITVHSSEMLEALIEPAMMIVDSVHSVLEKTPPELAADISDKGIYMTGGGCLVDGLDKLLQEKTGINVMIAQDAVSCVALGTGKALDNLDALDSKKIGR